MILNLQFLRALAAFMVIIYHWKPLLQQGHYGVTWLESGKSGVDLFFVISGFIMVYITDQKPTRPGDFLMHRVIRIMPLYAVMTLILFLVVLACPTFFGAIRPDFVDLVKSLFFIPFSKLNGKWEPLVPVGWTLNYEMFFYVLFFGSLFIKNRKVALWTVIGSLAFLIASRVMFDLKTGVIGFYTNQILAEFAFGMMLGFYYQKVVGTRFSPWVVGAVAFLSLGWIFATSWVAPFDARSLVAGIPAAFLVASALNLESRGWVVSNPFSQLLGAATYSIYLTHFFVLGLFIRVAQHLPLHGRMEYGLYLTLGTVVVFLVGIVVHLYLEKPLIRLARIGWTWRPGHALPTPLTAGEPRQSLVP